MHEAFGSEEECVRIQSGMRDSMGCVNAALSAKDAGVQLSDGRCFVEEIAVRAECLERSDCEEAAIHACPSLSAECLQTSNQLIVYLLQACPDIVSLEVP
jgi:hypothetical protein